MPNEPIMCTLTPGELAARRQTLLPGLLEQVIAREPLPEGLRVRFASDPGILSRIAAAIEAERHCCRFFRFELTVSAELISLDITGPPGTGAFLADLATG